jgi:hypothetical protein
MSSTLNVQQQFCLRIATGLAAASIAAMIPGFFEISLGWLRNTIRASGAIGIFLLIYSFNPPAMQQFVSLRELTGDWDYACTVSQGSFPGGEVQHGGTATIQIVRTKFGDALSISGNREWTRKNLESERVPVQNSSVWQTQGCNFTADDRLMYNYVTTDKGANYLGMTTLNIVKDQSGGLTLVGTFQRGPGAQNIYGTVFMRKRG